MMKKIVLLLFAVALSPFAGYAGGNQAAFNKAKAINVVSREDGAGTRGAFIELFGIEARGADGSRKDMTTKKAVIAKQTDVMMTNIRGDKYAAGYISLGSMNPEGVKSTSNSSNAQTSYMAFSYKK